MSFKAYEPILEAITQLLHPFVEVALHDLKTGKIVKIYNNISQRKVGDASPIIELNIKTKDFPAYFTPYYKENWDGRPLKCTSITIKDSKGKPTGLICINMDVSFFQEGMQLITKFLQVGNGENPVELHGENYEKQIEQAIDDYLDMHALKLSHLSREKKKDLAYHLYKKGFFNFKNAVPYIAKKLNTSRASIYNYIK